MSSGPWGEAAAAAPKQRRKRALQRGTRRQHDVDSDLLSKLLADITAENTDFVKDVKEFGDLQAAEKRRIAEDFEGLSNTTLDDFIQTQMEKLESEQELGQKNTIVNKKPNLNQPSKIETRLRHKKQWKKERTGQDEYRESCDVRLRDNIAFEKEKEHLRLDLTQTLGGSPRGMTLARAVFSPKRNNPLQDLLARPMWSSIHEDAYELFRRSRKMMKSLNKMSSNHSSHSLMSCFISMHEFRTAHIKSAWRTRVTQ